MKRLRVALILAVGVVIGHDLAVPASASYSARAAVFAIDGYRSTISPKLAGRIQCRFEPSCSWYGRESFRKYGFARGFGKTAWRIARCGPWTKQGTRELP